LKRKSRKLNQNLPIIAKTTIFAPLKCNKSGSHRIPYP